MTSNANDTAYTPDSLNSLVHQLGDLNLRVSWRALSRLIDIGPSAVEYLTHALLTSQERHIQERAARALGKIGDQRAVDSLIASLNNPTFQARWAAAQALRRLGAVDALLGILSTSEQPESRAFAASELGNLRAENAVGALGNALSDADPLVCAQAAAALGKLGIAAASAAGALLRALMAGLTEARYYVIEALAQLQVRDATPRLFALLLDPSIEQYTRWQIARALALIDSNNVSHALSNADPNVRMTFALHMPTWTATWPGGQRDVRAVPVLIEALSHRDPLLRLEAAQRLMSSRDLRAVEPLIAALTDSDAEVRQRAATALQALGDSRAVEPLILTLSDGDVRVRASAANALGWLRDARAVEPLLQGLADPEAHVRGSFVWALGQLIQSTPSAAQTMSRAHLSPEVLLRLLDHDGNARWMVALSLARICKVMRAGRINATAEESGAEIMDLLLGAFRSPNPRVRATAAETLGHLGVQLAIEPLVGALVDADEDVRRAAAEALGKIGGPRAVRELIKLEQDTRGTDSAFRHSIAVALENTRDPAVVESLVAVLQDTNEWVRERAARALGELGDKRAVEPLIGVLNSGAPRAFQAALALGKLRDRRAVEPLIAALRDGGMDHPQVSIYAAQALGQLRALEAVESLLDTLREARNNDHYWMATKAIEALGKLGDARAVEPVSDALGDESWQVRLAAATALGKLGDPSAVSALAQCLLQAPTVNFSITSELDESVHHAAIKSLGNLVVPDSPAFVRDTLHSAACEAGQYPSVRRAALRGLARMQDNRAVVPLLQELQEGNYRARHDAGKWLARVGSDAVPALLAVANSEHRYARRAIPWILGEIGDSRAIDLLVRALTNPDGRVRTRAARAIGKIGDARAIENIRTALSDPLPSVRASAVTALGIMGRSEDLHLLETMRSDQDANVRSAAEAASIRLHGG